MRPAHSGSWPLACLAAARTGPAASAGGVLLGFAGTTLLIWPAGRQAGRRRAGAAAGRAAGLHLLGGSDDLPAQHALRLDLIALTGGQMFVGGISHGVGGPGTGGGRRRGTGPFRDVLSLGWLIAIQRLRRLYRLRLAGQACDAGGRSTYGYVNPADRDGPGLPGAGRALGAHAAARLRGDPDRLYCWLTGPLEKQ